MAGVLESRRLEHLLEHLVEVRAAQLLREDLEALGPQRVSDVEAAQREIVKIVKRLEDERKTAGGIVIPDTAAEKPSQGEVVYVGPGKLDDNGKIVAMGVKTGDKILFGKYSGTEFKLDGNDYLHMREDDIIGIVA